MASAASTGRMVHAALFGTILLAAIVLSLLPGPPAEEAPLFLYATFGVAAVMFAGSLVLGSRLPRAPAGADAWWQENLPRVLVVWCMIEGASLLGAVVHFLTGSGQPLLVTAVGLVLLLLAAPGRVRRG